MAFHTQNSGGAFRSWVLLVVLLVVSIAIVTVYSREGEDGPLHAVQNTFADVMPLFCLPLQRLNGTPLNI